MGYKLMAWNPNPKTGRLRNAQDVTRLYAESLCRRISRRIIRYCEARKDCLLSGDDSVLGNLWDEVCVQVQFQKSFSWDAYEETLERLAFDYLTELADYEQLAIWLQTDEGWDWQWESRNNPDEIADRQPAFFLDDLARYLLRRYVYAAAANWSNRRIESYLARHSELDGLSE